MTRARIEEQVALKSTFCKHAIVDAAAKIAFLLAAQETFTFDSCSQPQTKKHIICRVIKQVLFSTYAHERSQETIWHHTSFFSLMESEERKNQ